MTPSEHLYGAGQMYPAAWKQVELFRAGKGADGMPDWPDWCFLPLGGWHAIVSERRYMAFERVADVARLAAIGTWRYSQGVYRFDPDVYAAIRSTELTGDLPAEVLFRLPEWCVYIETPGARWFDDELAGFWAHLEHDANTGRPELRLMLNSADALTAVIVHIGDWPLAEAVQRSIDEAASQAALHGIAFSAPAGMATALAAEVTGMVSLLLYICSDEPEIDDERVPGDFPRRARPVRTKKGWRIFPAPRVRTWRIGAQLGRQLRDASLSDATDRLVAPHIRRAHWHGFWTGPRAGERRLKYKWIPPIFVQGVRDDEQN